MGELNKEPLWTKNFISLSVANGLIYMVFYLLMMVVATYSMEILHTTPSQAGLIAGVFLLAALLARLFTGRYIEIIGKNKLVRYGTIFYLILLPCYFYVTNIYSFVLVRFLHGIGLGISTSALATLSVYIIPKSRRGEGIGYYSLSTTIAMALGPMFGMFMYSRWGFQSNLYFCHVLGVIIAIFIYMMKVPDFPVDQSKLKNMGTGLSAFFEKSALPISFIGTMCFFCYSSITGFLASYVKQINLVDTGNFFFLVYSLVLFISRPIMGRAYDKRGNIIMYGAMAPFFIGFFCLGKADSPLLLLLAAALLGFGFGNFNTIGRAISLEGLPEYKYGLASSTFLAVAEIGSGFGPFCLGIFLPELGYRNMYMFLGVIAIIAMVVFKIFYGRGKDRHENL